MGESKHPRCRQVGWVQSYLDNLLPPADRAEFESHLNSCPVCREELATFRNVQMVLADAAAASLPQLDGAAVEARIFTTRQREPERAWLPILLSAAALAAMVVVISWWPSPPAVPPAAPRAATEMAPEPALVSYFSGTAIGLVRQGERWVLGSGGTVDVMNGAVGLRLGSGVSVVLLENGRATVRSISQKVWEVDLQAGGLVARLRPGSGERLAVLAAGGTIEAMGTAFAVSSISKESTEIQLLEGSLHLETPGSAENLQAPAKARLEKTGVVRLGATDESAQAMLQVAERIDPFQTGTLGWVELQSAPDGAGVFVAGRDVGQTPVVLALPVGEQEVQVSLSAYEEVREKVAVAADRLVLRHYDLIPQKKTGPVGEDALAHFRKMLAAGELRMASEGLQKYLAANPKNAGALMLLGDALRLAGRPQEALVQYRKAVAASHDARLTEAAEFEGGLLQLHELNRPSDALSTFVSLRQQFPQGLLRQEVAFQLSECYLATKDYQRAVRALEDYLRLYPEGTKAQEATTLLQSLKDKGWR